MSFGIQGKIKSVYIAPIGTSLEASAIVGATSILVSNVDDFDVDGGNLTIGDNTDIVPYTTLTVSEGVGVDAEGTPNPPTYSIAVPTGLPDAVFEGDQVNVYPYGEEKLAIVVVTGNDDEGVVCRVPHEMTIMLDDGVRTEGFDDESVIIDQATDGDMYIKEIIGVEGKILSSQLDTVPQPTSDGFPPSQVLGVTARGSIRSVILEWPLVGNYDLVTYNIYGASASGFTPGPTNFLGTARGGQFFARQVYDATAGTLIDMYTGTPYYFRVSAFDEDGEGTPSAEVTAGPIAINSPDIAAFAVQAEHIDAGSITADKLAATIALFGEILIGDRMGLRASGPQNGLRIELSNGGHIYLPADGTDVDLNRVKARLTEAIIEGNMQILGSTNRIGGSLTLDATVAPPSVAPLVQSVFDQSPLLGPGFDSGYYGSNAGLGFDATYFYSVSYSGEFIEDPAGTPIADYSFTVYRTNRSTGAITAYWTQSGYPSSNDGGTVIGYSHSAAYDVVAVAYAGDDPQVRIFVRNNSTTTVINYRWDTFNGQFNGPYKWPAIYTDGTNIYLAACNTSSGRINLYRYSMTMGSRTFLFQSAVGMAPNANLFSLYIGNGDFGVARYIIASTNVIYSFDSSFARQTAEEWAVSGGETMRGMIYDGSRFYSFHTSGRIRKYSNLLATTARLAKFTWTNPAGPTESTASPQNTSVNQEIRKFLKVTASSIPSTGDPTGPTAVQFYVTNQKQAVTGAGVVTAIYEIPATGGAASPGSDGFALLGLNGSVTSEAQFSGGAPKILLKGDGGGNVGKFFVDKTTGNPTKVGYTDFQKSTNSPNTTSTTNITITGLSITVTVDATTDEYWIDIDADVSAATSGTVNVIGLLVDGVEDSQLLFTGMPTSGLRISGHRRWKITGLSAGSHTFTARTRNSAASTNATVQSSTMSLERKR